MWFQQTDAFTLHLECISDKWFERSDLNQSRKRFEFERTGLFTIG